ncbi:MAG: ATP-grasp fold amidoligase family protein [Cellulomonas sp.]
MAGIRRRLQHRALNDYRRSSTRELRAPSYTYQRLELSRVRRRMRELGGQDPAYEINAKDSAYAWARGLGVRTPALLAAVPDVGAIRWADLPDRFVLKPCHGTASTGVYLLERTADSWLELLTRRTLTTINLESELRDLARRGIVSSRLLLEELVVDPRRPGLPPIDYKVSTFFGEVGLIEAKSHGVGSRGQAVSTWKVFDPEWSDLGNVFGDYATDPAIPAPLHAEALLDLARRISLAVPRPYLRVDLYDDAAGPVFGEITPEPGGEVLVRPDVDRLLGEHWEQAQARLHIRAARMGILTPAARYGDPTDRFAGPGADGDDQAFSSDVVGPSAK